VRLFLPKKTRNGPAKPRGKVCPGAADRSDADEIDSLYREFGSALLLFAVSITGDRSHAQDAVHQVLLKMIEDQNLGQARNKKAYLLACVRNAVLNEILDGTAPYDDLKYKDLVEKNKAALRTLTRPTLFQPVIGAWTTISGKRRPSNMRERHWVLDTSMFSMPSTSWSLAIEMARLGPWRLDCTFRKEVANDGSLSAALSAKDLMVTHSRAVALGLHRGGLSVARSWQ
jgi:hypothetical protein